MLMFSLTRFPRSFIKWDGGPGPYETVFGNKTHKVQKNIYNDPFFTS